MQAPSRPWLFEWTVRTKILDCGARKDLHHVGVEDQGVVDRIEGPALGRCPLSILELRLELRLTHHFRCVVEQEERAAYGASRSQKLARFPPRALWCYCFWNEKSKKGSSVASLTIFDVS